jgi:hypothetical protein
MFLWFLVTASILLGIELLKLLRYSLLMSSVHIFRMAYLNYGTEIMSWLLSLLLMRFQAFSSGLANCQAS